MDDDGNAVNTRILAIHQAQDFVWTLSTSHGLLHTTADHPLKLWDGSFALAEEIAPDTLLARWERGRTRATRLVSISTATQTSKVYTLTVGGPHTFVADGFIVHNKGGGGGGGWGGGGHSWGHGSSTQPWNDFDWFELIFIAIIIGWSVISWLIKNPQNWHGDPEELDYVHPRSAISAKAERTAKLARYLSDKNPLFELPQIQDVARHTFPLLEQCWQARDYSPMKPLLTPDLFEQHRQLLLQMVHQHEINRIENLQIKAVDLVHLDYSHSPGQCHITVLITACARDYYVDDRTGAFRRGDQIAVTFQEFWIFQRNGDTWLLADIEQSRESGILKQENVVEGWTPAQLAGFYRTGELQPQYPAIRCAARRTSMPPRKWHSAEIRVWTAPWPTWRKAIRSGNKTHC